MRQRSSSIYATDINEAVLQRAKDGIFPLNTMQENTSNYIAAGGTGTFSQYYTARYDYAIFRPALRENVVFAQHNLVTDSSFNHFNVIFCRNVLIYFNNALQERVQRLFLASMEMFGILGLGKKETIRYSTVADNYEEIDAEERLYRRVRGEMLAARRWPMAEAPSPQLHGQQPTANGQPPPRSSSSAARSAACTRCRPS